MMLVTPFNHHRAYKMPVTLRWRKERASASLSFPVWVGGKSMMKTLDTLDPTLLGLGFLSQYDDHNGIVSTNLWGINHKIEAGSKWFNCIRGVHTHLFAPILQHVHRYLTFDEECMVLLIKCKRRRKVFYPMLKVNMRWVFGCVWILNGHLKEKKVFQVPQVW